MSLILHVLALWLVASVFVTVAFHFTHMYVRGGR